MPSVSQPCFDFSEPDPEPLKRCAKCREEKPRTAFVRDSRRLDGLYPYCRRCRSRCPERYRELGPRPPSPERLCVTRGYIRVWARDHPHAINGRMLEHRLVMEEKLGRYLGPDEVVHHLDGNTQNNDPDNLELTTRTGHAHLHAPELRARFQNQVSLTCQECGAEFSIRRSLGECRKYCSRACYIPNWVREMQARKAAKRLLRTTEKE